MPRLLIVSNRLPVTVRLAGGEVRVERSTGGLATGLGGLHERLGGGWIGWSGAPEGLSAGAAAEVAARLAAQRLLPVPLSTEEIARYYEGYANGALWPLFHYEVARLPQEVRDFEVYEAVNARFADAVVEHYRPGDHIWIHDYQLMLVPELVRERLPDARIGFFLHIPFPSSEIFRVLPQRERILQGLLGADLIGFHTAAFVRHFASSVLRLLSAPTAVDRITWRGRSVRLGVFPMGIDAATFSAQAATPEVLESAAAHRADGVRLLVGIDRLDYTKGIARRLAAYEILLRRHPELHGKVRLMQVAVPSRENVEAYRELRGEVEAMVGRIQGEFATTHWSPVRYVYRGLSQEELVALYRAADVVLVTPLRDGMNLVAKEFIAARPDLDGVLVLSELAGAAAELSEALLVNPYDLEQTAAVLHRALELPLEERQARMEVLRDRVMRYDVHWWARTFTARLDEASAAAEVAAPSSSPATLEAAVARAVAAPRLVLLLDYDGTLVPFARTPDLATPDPELLALLRTLAARPRTAVHLVSGRRRASLERWFGALHLGLFAEHGFWSRLPEGEWKAAQIPPADWREPVRSILREFAERTPGSLVEEKTAGYAWHYRAADPEFGSAQAKDLSLHLSMLLGNAPVEVLPGDHVIEVRPHGVNKGLAVAAARARAGRDAVFFAVGDDRTDEDLFAALPEGALAVHVGTSPSRAALRVPDVAAARRLLTRIAEDRPAAWRT